MTSHFGPSERQRGLTWEIWHGSCLVYCLFSSGPFITAPLTELMDYQGAASQYGPSRLDQAQLL